SSSKSNSYPPSRLRSSHFALIVLQQCFLCPRASAVEQTSDALAFHSVRWQQNDSSHSPTSIRKHGPNPSSTTRFASRNFKFIINRCQSVSALSSGPPLRLVLFDPSFVNLHRLALLLALTSPSSVVTTRMKKRSKTTSLNLSPPPAASLSSPTANLSWGLGIGQFESRTSIRWVESPMDKKLTRSLKAQDNRLTTMGIFSDVIPLAMSTKAIRSPRIWRKWISSGHTLILPLSQ
ncbi:hypothetical protein HD554DRAFT_748330, partial [Boletus coccyginus]